MEGMLCDLMRAPRPRFVIVSQRRKLSLSMCGICGFVTTENTPIEESLLEAMVARLEHRGPDDGGGFGAQNMTQWLSV